METDKNNPDTFADDHLKLLLTVADKIPCDTGNAIDLEPEIPSWFDAEKFKRGQDYYHDNIFGMFTAKMCGLLVVIAVPSILRILVHSGRSSTAFTAYRRYVATILHTTLWYDYKMETGSNAWSSLLTVRRRHLLNSQSACKKGVGVISQKDMALTQFGFMGFILIRPRLLGIKSDSREDREAFVHVWRTIGHVLGIQDRFNICFESLEKTEATCEAILSKLFNPYMTTPDADFSKMAAALLEGLWPFNPFLEHDTFLYFTKRLLGVANYEYFDQDYEKRDSCNNNNNNNIQQEIKHGSTTEYEKLSWWSKAVLYMMIMTHQFLLTYHYLRLYFNYRLKCSLFLIKYFPFLGYYQYGFKAAHVNIYIDNYNERELLARTTT